MASISPSNVSFIPDTLESSPATTVLTTIHTEDVKWVWFVVPFVTALIIFFCFECLVLSLLCRRNRYRKAHHLLLTDAVGKPMYSTDDLNENVVLSGYRGIRTSISSLHDTREHFASTEYCSVCGGNTTSRDVLVHGTSSFRGYRDHRRHTKDGVLLYGEPLADHSILSNTVDEADSYDDNRYAGEPSYNPRHVSRAFRALSSVSDVYTARSTDAEDDTYTPRFTPTVSRSISEDLASSNNAIDETAPLSIERHGGEVPTQAQQNNSVYRHPHYNSLDSHSSTSYLSDHQLMNLKPRSKILVKTNGHRVNNFLDRYFVNRGRLNTPHSKDPKDPLSVQSVPTSNSVTVEGERGDSTVSNSPIKAHEHYQDLQCQEEDTRHFIESYLASSRENVSVTVCSYV